MNRHARGFAALIALTLTFGAIAATTSAAPASTTTTTRLKVAVMIVNFKDDRSTPFDAGTLRGSVFTDTKSAATYWREASGGRVEISGDVFGPLRLSTNGAGCRYAKWMRQAKKKLKRVLRESGRTIGDYTNFQIWFPNNGCWGMGGVGAGLATPATDSWVTNFPGWGTEKYWMWSAHELGHNLGLTHASVWRCSADNGRTFVTLTADTSKCNTFAGAEKLRNLEYNDPVDVMGGTNLEGWQPTNFHRSQLGALTPTSATSGTFTLAANESAYDGQRQAITIPRPDGTELWLEYRQAVGVFDASMAHDDPAMLRGVTVRVVDTRNGSTQAREYLLDMTPNTHPGGLDDFGDAPLGPGLSWTDPSSHVRITVKALTPSAATVVLSAG